MNNNEFVNGFVLGSVIQLTIFVGMTLIFR